MLPSLVQIVVGLIVWKLAPGWIQSGSRKSRAFFKLCLNIIGIVIVIFGVVSIIKEVLSIFH
ncbi:MAG: hypothetical protein WCP85_15160 [Mariniphaga sp.]